MNVKTESPVIHAALADVALIDGTTSGAVGGLSLSWWLAEVAAGRAPAPAVRMSRCTRWRVSDVRAFWVKFAEAADGDEAARVVMARSKKASAAAQTKRAAAALVE
jgi:hypothetical protein